MLTVIIESCHVRATNCDRAGCFFQEALRQTHHTLVLSEGGPSKSVVRVTVGSMFLLSWKQHRLARVDISSVPLHQSLQALRKFMKRLMDNRYRYYTYIFVSLWKMIIFFGMTILTVYAKDSYQPLAVSKMFTNFKTFFSLRHINVTEIRPVLSGTGLPDLNDVTPASGITEMEAWHMAPIWVFVIHSFSAYLCYIFGKFACKIRIQTVSFAFPINLAVPVTVSLLALVCGLRTADPCVFSGVIPDYLFFNSPDIYNLGAFLTSQVREPCLQWCHTRLSVLQLARHLQTRSIHHQSGTSAIRNYNSFMI
uniref:(California timema) hypothetical protein n=1 Tax=Timema californicum TaxID=61474 RepID=A0A7R9JAC7_TIMCA|nr:unnamed protein product [Timema californicum]